MPYKWSMTEPNRAVQEEELEALRAIFEVRVPGITDRQSITRLKAHRMTGTIFRPRRPHGEPSLNEAGGKSD